MNRRDFLRRAAAASAAAPLALLPATGAEATVAPVTVSTHAHRDGIGETVDLYEEPELSREDLMTQIWIEEFLKSPTGQEMVALKAAHYMGWNMGDLSIGTSDALGRAVGRVMHDHTIKALEAYNRPD